MQSYARKRAERFTVKAPTVVPDRGLRRVRRRRVIHIIEPPELDAHREELAAWLKANGIDPHEVSADRPFIVERHDDGLYDLWHYTFVLTPDGAKQVDPHVPDQPWMKLRSARVQDTPAGLRDDHIGGSRVSLCHAGLLHTRLRGERVSTPFTTDDMRAVSYTIDRMTKDRNESGIEYGGYDGPQLTYKDQVMHLTWQADEDSGHGRYVLDMHDRPY